MGATCSSCSEYNAERANERPMDIDKKTRPSETEGVAVGQTREIKEYSLTVQSSASQSISLQSPTYAQSPATPGVFDLSKVDSLFEDLAKFMRDLPVRSKGHIWKHSMKAKGDDGSKTVVDKANDEHLILKLLTDIVIVYVKYLDRNREPLTTKEVKPHVEAAAKWIFEKYHELDRNLFENDKNYFSSMLEAYQARTA